jgi:hypothetical protein
LRGVEVKRNNIRLFGITTFYIYENIFEKVFEKREREKERERERQTERERRRERERERGGGDSVSVLTFSL